MDDEANAVVDTKSGLGLAEYGFETALVALKSGHKISRKGWNGPNQWLHIQFPDASSKMTLPYVYIRTVQGGLVPWICSQTDMMANDWIIL